MNKDIKLQIENIVEPERSEFQKKLFKTAYPVLGSRVPEIRKIAKKNKDLDLNRQDEDESYEELLLRGFIIAYNKDSVLDKNERIKAYLEKIDSWALCDSFCSTFKIKKEEFAPLFENLKDYLDSELPFFKRYALVMFLAHFIKLDKDLNKLRRPKLLTLKDLNNDPEGSYIAPILELIDREYDDHNASLAAAWLICEAFLLFPKTVLKFLRDNHLDNVTLNKAVQKIRESNVPDKEVKAYFKSGPWQEI